MNALVIGSGGREHALVRKLALSPQLETVYVAPGNPGMEESGTCVMLDTSDQGSVAAWAKDKSVDLVVIGPEVPLAEGLADTLTGAGIPTFGPSAKGAEIESSKAFAKGLMQKYGIPTAEFVRCQTFEEAQAAIDDFDARGIRAVVKASGLAAGKGAVVTDTAAEAKATAKEMMVDRIFGEAGDVVVIEERMSGPEVSIFALTDGTHAVILPPSQDHKPIGEGDTGLNTGGMGAYCPVPIMNDALLQEIVDTVLLPTVQALEKEGRPYCGCLYGGLMMVDGKSKVIEFNCRFGDPETQAVLAAFDEDLFPILLDCAMGRLTGTRIVPADRAAGMVVLASGGYPGGYEKGKTIRGLETFSDETDLWVVHAGTKRDQERIVTSGGRVLGVVGTSDAGLIPALDRTYEGVRRIEFENAYYRKDIGYRVRNA